MKLLFGAAALAAVALAVSGAASGRPAASSVTVSRLVEGGDIRITATIGTPVAVGHALQIRFLIRNVSHQPRKISLGFGDLWFVVHASDGTRYDTRVLTRGVLGPLILPTKLKPGAAVTRDLSYTRERWSGPLRVVPGWDRTAFPRVRVAVTTPGPPRNGRVAVAAVVAKTGGLLDDCSPKQPGVAVTGLLHAPRHSAPPMGVRCSIGLQRERGFDVAQLLVVTTPGPRAVHLDRRYERFTFPTRGTNATEIAWQFVVTRDGATSVDSTSVESTKSGKAMAPDWQWTTSGYEGHPGGSKCGGTGGGGGGAIGPYVEFVSICPR